MTLKESMAALRDAGGSGWDSIEDPDAFLERKPSVTQVKQAEQNGILRIARKGRCQFAFGDDPAFTIDVVAVYDEWCQIDASFRNAEGVLPPDQVVAYAGAKLSYVQQIATNAYQQIPGTQVPTLSHAEAAEFIALVQSKVEELRPFFGPRSAGTPSSRESTDIRFSQ